MKRKILILSAVILMVVISGIVALYWCSQPPGCGKECIFTVEKGWGARRISQVLTDSGLVRCRLYLLWRYSRMDGSLPLQAGIYQFDDSMSPDSILGILTRGDVLPVQTSWVTISPGLTLAQSLGLISEGTGIPETVLDSLSADSAFLASNSVPVLEGYLFPETYEFADTLDASEILSRIIETGKTRWPRDIDELLENTGLTLHETIILASIVEREARVDSERAVIAGVFLSRVRSGMKLESCATVQYALGEVKEVLLYSDLEIEDPYNTYIYEGLPPGPICSPGLPSIHAAFSPDTEEGYLYFVSRDDGTGMHLFARTYRGHLSNIRSTAGR
ncbi:endolytic transglycosylase MltG [Candidatus Fermentibacteria bacterium]|nr:MAG: endolytic transglycosylase MltG [Candidatus Fermentibacteria bacterium]